MDTPNSLSAVEVAQFLKANPDFFDAHADVFSKLMVPHPHQSRAISLGERQITIDCDVLQADGGTRTAAITGAMVALVDALKVIKKRGGLKGGDPLKQMIAAVSVGMYQGEPVLDLDYLEDSAAETDLNVVMTSTGGFIGNSRRIGGGVFSRGFAVAGDQRERSNRSERDIDDLHKAFLNRGQKAGGSPDAGGDPGHAGSAPKRRGLIQVRVLQWCGCSSLGGAQPPLVRNHDRVTGLPPR